MGTLVGGEGVTESRAQVLHGGATWRTTAGP